MRKAVKKVLGQEKYNFFFDRLLEYFFTEKDAEFFASLGLNCIRWALIHAQYRVMRLNEHWAVFRSTIVTLRTI